MSFYVTLPSNSNIDTHPENTGGKFTVTLQEPLYLDTTWQVGLAEAVYHRDWDNVRDNENDIVVEYMSGWETTNTEGIFTDAKYAYWKDYKDTEEVQYIEMYNEAREKPHLDKTACSNARCTLWICPGFDG